MHHRIVAALRDRLAIDALGFVEAPRFVQQQAPVDAGLPVARRGGPGGWARALDHAQRTVGWIAVEREQVLPRIRLPAAVAVADHYAIGHGADAQSRKRHRRRQVAAPLLPRFP